MPQHLALYRKWRPLTFSDVTGQSHITDALRAQVASQRVSHAYLFTGTRGTGKTTCAKILARAACCERPVDGDPCNECASCRSVLSDAALDVSEIDAASNNGVDNIREIREEAFFAPTVLRRRVYIIDEVHMLSPGAFNALLKILEEPPEHVLFILATTEIHKVPATVLSRCQRYDFRRIAPETIKARLTLIAEGEGMALHDDAAALLSRLGDGSMRDAISLLDRSAGGGGDITRDRVVESLGIVPADTVSALLGALLARDTAQALLLFDACYQNGRDIVSLFDELISLVRDIYIIKVTENAGLLAGALPVDEAELRRYAKDYDAQAFEHIITCASELLTRMTRTAIKRIDAEMCLFKMCMSTSTPAPATASAPAPVAAVQSAPIAQTDSAAAKSPRKEPPPDTGAQAAAESSPAASMAQGGDIKKEFCDKAGARLTSAARTYLSMADISADNGRVHIDADEAGLIFLEKPAVLQVISETAQAMGFEEASITKKGAGRPDAAAGKLGDLLDTARNLGIKVNE